jgi:MFS family permease
MRAIFLLLLLAGGNFFNVIDRNVVSLFMPVIRDDLHLSSTQQGLILGLAFILVLSFVAIPIARMTDRFGSRHVIGASLFVWSFATFISGYAGSFAQLFGTRMVVGAAESGFTPAAHAALTAMFKPKNLGRALAVFTLGVSAGQVLGFYASGQMAEGFGWRGGLHVLGGIGVVLALIIWVAWPFLFPANAQPRPVGERPGMVKAFRQLFTIPGFGPLVLAAMAHSVAAFAVQQLLPTFLSDHFHMPVAERGLWMGPVFSLAAVAGTISMGFVIDFFNPATKLRTCLRLAGFSVMTTVPLYWAGLLFPDSLGAFMPAAMMNAIFPGLVSPGYEGLLIFIPAFFLGAIYYAPTYFVLQNLASAENRASANAVLITGFQIAGLGLGPTLVGLGTDALTYFGVVSPLGIAMSIVATLNGVSGVLFLWAERRLRRASP